MLYKAKLKKKIAPEKLNTKAGKRSISTGMSVDKIYGRGTNGEFTEQMARRLKKPQSAPLPKVSFLPKIKSNKSDAKSYSATKVKKKLNKAKV